MNKKSSNSDSLSQIHNGKLSNAEWLASPNFNQRPHINEKQIEIEAIVIHNISLPPNEFQQTNKEGIHYVKAFFTNTLDWDDHPYFQTIKGLKVSAHLFIERNGFITQFVNFNDRAWHAGRSSYLGRKACNDFSIGIEMEGSDFQTFTELQYESLANTINAIYQEYPKTCKHLVGHSDIAPGRKTDPGDYFDWAKLRQMVNDKRN